MAINIKIKSIDDINMDTDEGKLLIAAIAMLNSHYPTKNIEWIIDRLGRDYEFVISKFN